MAEEEKDKIVLVKMRASTRDTLMGLKYDWKKKNVNEVILTLLAS